MLKVLVVIQSSGLSAAGFQAGRFRCLGWLSVRLSWYTGAMYIRLSTSLALHGAIAVRISVFVVVIVLGGFTTADGALPTIGFPVTFRTLHASSFC